MNSPKKTNLRRSKNKQKGFRTQGVGSTIIADRENSAKERAKSDEQSKNHLMDAACSAKGDKTNTSKLSELSVSCFSLSLYQHPRLQANTFKEQV